MINTFLMVAELERLLFCETLSVEFIWILPFALCVRMTFIQLHQFRQLSLTAAFFHCLYTFLQRFALM